MYFPHFIDGYFCDLTCAFGGQYTQCRMTSFLSCGCSGSSATNSIMQWLVTLVPLRISSWWLLTVLRSQTQINMRSLRKFTVRILAASSRVCRPVWIDVDIFKFIIPRSVQVWHFTKIRGAVSSGHANGCASGDNSMQVSALCTEADNANLQQHVVVRIRCSPCQ